MCDARGESNRIRIYVPPEDELYCMSDWGWEWTCLILRLKNLNMVNSRVDKLEWTTYETYEGLPEL